MAQLSFYYKDRVSSHSNLSIICATDELYNRGYDFYTKAYKIAKKLTKEDIQKTAKEYLINPQVLILENNIEKIKEN